MVLVTVSSFQQKDKENKGKGNKEQPKDNKGKGQDKDDADKGKGNDKGNDKGNGNNKDKDNEGNNGNGNDKDNKGRNKAITDDGYRWDNETFKDRNDIRKGQDKVTICHKFNRADEPAVTIRVSAAALKAHMGHGDVQGDCPAVTNTRFSDGFLKQRTDYYTLLSESQEQVIYSQSILDYALQRLTGVKTQYLTLQNSNVPAADLERKRLVVVELEDNVSLLRTLVGVTANLVANKLVQ
ncbi:MAG: hypothetical protein K0Q66_2318 [Chitinophagaceae bacterium]|nr:hypothetical protein [Chitinophagaceae bacterium]